MPRVTMISPGAAALINILLNLVLIPKWGIVGASLASSICYGLMLVMSVAYVRYKILEGRS
jgi:O-antigen/teichoic acid export membrane protein